MDLEQWDFVVDGGWVECTILNDGGNLSAVIPYRFELDEYTSDELLSLLYEYPKIEWQ